MDHLVLEIGLALTLVAGAALLSNWLRFSIVPFLILTGMIVGPHAPKIGPLVVPFRDFFGAVFFFGFGLTIDPFTLGGGVWLAIGAVVLTVTGNVLGGILAGRSAGLSPSGSLNIGLTIVSRGEFSIILANVAKAGGLLPIIQPFAALYVLILAILGPVLTKESERIYDLSERLFERKSSPQRLEGEITANGNYE